MSSLVHLRRILVFIGLVIQCIPAIVRGMAKAAGSRVQADNRARRGYHRIRQLPLGSPHVREIPATTVDSIEEYLTHLKAGRLRDRVYRGQASQYQIGVPDSLSLLPTMAREHTTLRKPGFRIERAFSQYVDEVILQHVTALGSHGREAHLFVKAAAGKASLFDNEAYYLSRTAQGRFIGSLYPTINLPYAYQAALQHYGFPTLALDVTFSPLVALFFATCRLPLNASGARICQPAGSGGVVYVLAVPAQDVVTHPELGNLPGAVRPTFVDLSDLSWDSDTRARRQYAALLCRLLHVDLPVTPHFNSYAFDVVEIIRLSDRFWQHPSTRDFLDGSLGGWFFPGPEVDRLAALLGAADRLGFERYDLGPIQRCRDPRGQFEYLQLRRIVLTGTDTDTVRRLFAGTWYARKRSLEELPVHEVLRLVENADESIDIDVIVVCEPTKPDGQQLCSQIRRLGRGADRWYGIVDASPIGRKIDPPSAIVMSLGDAPHVIVDDSYDSDVSLQRAILDAYRATRRFRYDDRMKPSARDWQKFLPRSFGVISQVTR